MHCSFSIPIVTADVFTTHSTFVYAVIFHLALAVCKLVAFKLLSTYVKNTFTLIGHCFIIQILEYTNSEKFVFCQSTDHYYFAFFFFQLKMGKMKGPEFLSVLRSHVSNFPFQRRYLSLYLCLFKNKVLSTHRHNGIRTTRVSQYQ